MNTLICFTSLVGVALCAPPSLKADAGLGIYDGKAAQISKYPYMVSITSGDFLVGAGVILNENWVLSSGYISAAFSVEDLTIRAGSNKWNTSGQVVISSENTVHPRYTGNWDYDVAVFKLQTPLKLEKHVQAATLGTKKLAAGTTGQTLGWGPTSDTSVDPAKVLQVADNTVLDNKTCKSTYSWVYGPSLFCCKTETAGPCASDYGGPLVVDGVVYGLYAGVGASCSDTPRVYTNIPNLAKWIKQAIKH